MKNINFTTILKRLKRSFPLLFSTFAALCLFLQPVENSIAVVVLAFVVVAAAILYNQELSEFPKGYLRWDAIIIAVILAFTGCSLFVTTWTSSNKAAAWVRTFQMSPFWVFLILGLIGCVIGFYAIYTLSGWIIVWTRQLLKKHLPEQDRFILINNLKRNWYFPVSAMAFFSLRPTLTVGYFVGLLIAFGASCIIASQFSSMLNVVRQSLWCTRVISFLTALGICWGQNPSFCTDWKASMLRVVVALFFVFFCVLMFWKQMRKVFSENALFKDIKAAEWIVYGVLVVATILCVVVVFFKTDAFYGTKYPYDIIYTSDSPKLVQGNAYLILNHSENDIRQPLFAVFSAPFLGFPYLVAKLFSGSVTAAAILMNAVQVVILFTANFILAKMLKLDSIRRVCFVLLMSSTYTHLLFVLMMEQYIIAYFWLILCLYLIAEKHRPERIALWGAGGTLLTGMILLPLMSEQSPFKNFRAYLADVFRYGLEFIALMLVFCRFDIIFNLIPKVSRLSGFAGVDLTMKDKLFQYLAFVKNYFIAPDAGINTTACKYISWQLNPITGISVVGVVILLLMVVSAVLNKGKRSSRLAIGWVIFSMVILLVFGWGTQENGLILYALYFGWAFMVLLIQFIEWVGDKLHIRALFPVLTIGCTVLLVTVNIPAIADMIEFATTYYPV